MAASTPPRSVHSLRDLRRLIPVKSATSFRQRRYTAYLDRLAAKDKPVSDDSPLIPCARCGGNLPYSQAVARHLGEGFVGYAHPEGGCNEAFVLAWQAKQAAISARTARKQFAHEARS